MPASRSAASPPTMIVSSPASVELTLPDTGASRIPASRARTAPATDRIASGRTVLQSTATEPARIPAATPSGPSNSARTASSSATIEIVTSAARRGLGRRRRDGRSDPLGQRGGRLR